MHQAPGRRRFLSSCASLGAGWFSGCDAVPIEGNEPPLDASPDAGIRPAPAISLAKASFIRNIPFVGEGDPEFGVLFNQGLDARKYTDLSTLESGTLDTPTDEFYVRTATPDQLDRSLPWSVRIHGLVERERSLTLDDLTAATRTLGPYLLECSGNSRQAGFGLMSQARWGGIPLLELLNDMPSTDPNARLLVTGFDSHSQASVGNRSQAGASWIFSQEQLAKTGAFLATGMNGSQLPSDHGAPVRLFVPGWYGCCSIKWVTEIEWVADDAPATSQMQEFAARTHQDGVPELARQFAPAEMDTAAMPIAVELWRIDDRELLRIVGITWGGNHAVAALEIRVGDSPWQLFDCDPSSAGPSFSLWEFVLDSPDPGTYALVLRVPDRSVRTRRLDSEFYLREIKIT